MVAGNMSSEKIDLLVHGPSKPIVDNGFSDQYVLHHFETIHDLERLSPEVAAKVRGMAVTYNSVRADSKTLARFPKLEIVSSFGVGYDHVDAAYARDHNIMVTNTPDVLTEEVADIAMGLLIAALTSDYQTQIFSMQAIYEFVDFRRSGRGVILQNIFLDGRLQPGRQQSRLKTARIR